MNVEGFFSVEEQPGVPGVEDYCLELSYKIACWPEPNSINDIDEGIWWTSNGFGASELRSRGN